MDENIKNKLSEVLSGLDKEGISGIGDLLNSQDGKRLVNSLSDAEKKRLIQKFMSMDSDAIDKKLKNLNKNSVKNITADDIKKKLR